LNTKTRPRVLTRGQALLLARHGYKPSDIGRMWNRSAPQLDADDITIPDTPSGLEELIGDSARMQKVFANKGQFAEVIKAYARTVLDKHQEISQQVDTQVKDILTNFLKENDAEGIKRVNLDPRNPLPTIAQQKGKLYNAKALGAKIDREYGTTGEFFAAIASKEKDATTQTKLQRLRNAFGSTIPAEGGFLIPETLRSEMLRVALETSVVRPRARVIPMEALRVPIPAIDSTSNVSSIYGGIVAYWTEEGGALQASEAKFGRVVLDAKKLTAYTEVPSELVSDSIISFQAFINDLFPEALGWYEDLAFMKGTGVGEPLGAFHAGNQALIAVSKESGQDAGTILWENIVSMYTRMLPSSIDRAVWVVSTDTFKELATMALSVGTGGSAIWLNNGQEGPPMTILGCPVIRTEKTSGVLGTQGDISFVDFGFYLIGDRQAMSSTASEHYKFGHDMIAFRVIERLDGRPWLQAPISPQNGGPTLSPFVQLETRA